MVAELSRGFDPGGSQAEPLIVIGSGPRNARTDHETGLRYYTWEGRELPSVTTVRRLAGIPHPLAQWQISQVINRATTEHWSLIKMLTRPRRPRERVLEKNRREEAGKWLRRAVTEERDVAAALGIAVHDAAAQGLDPETVDPAVRPRLLQFRSWLATAQPEIIATEFQCWNLTVGYAGTADLLVRLLDGTLCLIDLKTGKGTYAEHALQLIAYRNAEFVGNDNIVDARLTEILTGATGVSTGGGRILSRDQVGLGATRIAVLHLADDHWEFRAVAMDDPTWVAFRGLLAFARWSDAHRDVDAVTIATRRSA